MWKNVYRREIVQEYLYFCVFDVQSDKINQNTVFQWLAKCCLFFSTSSACLPSFFPTAKKMRARDENDKRWKWEKGKWKVGCHKVFDLCETLLKTKFLLSFRLFSGMFAYFCWMQTSSAGESVHVQIGGRKNISDEKSCTSLFQHERCHSKFVVVRPVWDGFLPTYFAFQFSASIACEKTCKNSRKRHGKEIVSACRGRDIKLIDKTFRLFINSSTFIISKNHPVWPSSAEKVG